MSDGYQVQLPVFEGPLDLLLHLIEAQQLDITKVSLAQVTQQYLDYIAHAEAINPDHLADFLVVAAKLIYIKSTVLLPQTIVSEEEEDAGDDLVRQLLLYRQFKRAAEYLRALEEQGNRAFVRVAAPVDLPRTLDLDGVTLEALVEAVREALAVAPPAPPVNDVVAPLIITVDEKIAYIRARLARRGRVAFRDLVRQARSRMEVIVTFLAVLEMIKRQMAEAYQETLFGEVFIAPLTLAGGERDRNGLRDP